MATAVRIGLVAFVLAWILGPNELRTTVPIWIPFLLALGLEVNFLVGALRPGARRRPDRGPQAVDVERFGYLGEPEDDDGEGVEEGEEGDEWEEDEAWEPEPGPPRRPLRRFLAGLGLIAALGAAVWAVERSTGWDALDERTRAAAATRFSEEASRIARKPVTIRCDESGSVVGAVQHADGAARVGGDTAYLTPQRCLDLYRLAFDGEIRPSQTARAIAVLAHEAWHLRGVRDEGTTECYALQSGVELGRRLGLAAGTARELMRQQLAENPLRGRGSPEYVVPPDCREGSRLDLAPDDPRFP